MTFDYGKRNEDMYERLIDAIARGEITTGGLAEAGWFYLGTVAEQVDNE